MHWVIYAGLKSKLRHKLADLHDLEESEANESGDLQRVKQDLSDVRQQLHAALTQEDALLVRV